MPKAEEPSNIHAEPTSEQQNPVIAELLQFAPVIDGKHCFHAEVDREDLFWPNRKFGPEAHGRMNTIRNVALETSYLIQEHVESQEVRELVQKMLVNLAENNAFARIHPLGSQAADLIPVIKSHGDSKYKNCIALIINRKRLATVGGFNDTMHGESLTETAGREGHEETKGAMDHYVHIGEQSNPIRDERKPIISSVTASLTELDSLQAGDDADNLVVVRIFDDSGNLIVEPLLAGHHVDVRGVEFTHKGMRADHLMILYENLNAFYRKFRKDKTEPLEDVVARMSATIDQKWFHFDPESFHEDKYDKVEVRDTAMLMTPNMLFVRGKIRDMLQIAGVPEDVADQQALRFMAKLKRADILPEFPESASTSDLILLSPDKPDHITVGMWPDGRLFLPGTFFTPDTSKMDNLVSSARASAWRKFGLDAHIFYCLGVVGGKVATGKLTDRAYPRNSFVFVGANTGLYEALPRELPEGSTILDIPLFKPGTREPSDVIRFGIDGKGWGFSHNTEILLPWLYPFMDTVDPDHKLDPLTLFGNLK